MDAGPKRVIIDASDKSRGLAIDTQGAAKVIDSIHSRIHAGEMFEAAVFEEDVGDNSDLELRIVTAAAQTAHCRFALSSGGDARIRFYEGATPTTDGAGTAFTPKDRNRVSANDPVTGFFSGPSISVYGTVLLDTLLAGGTGGNASGGNLSTFEEWILAANTVYLMRLTNVSGGAKSMSIGASFYEPS